MKKCGLRLVVLAIVGLMFLGCTTRLVDFTLISSKNVDLSRMGEFRRGSSRVKGDDTMWWILFIPTKLAIDVKAALDKAIESVPGCVALVDGVIYYKSWYAVLVGQGAYVVEGTPLIDPNLASGEVSSNYILTTYDEEAGKFVSRFVSREEYMKVSEAVKEGAVPEKL